MPLSIGAQRYHGSDISDTSRVYGGRGFGYNYDPIGNRTSASETIGGESLVKSYTANELNQYTAIANPDAVGLRGDATNTATVTVNGNNMGQLIALAKKSNPDLQMPPDEADDKPISSEYQGTTSSCILRYSALLSDS